VKLSQGGTLATFRRDEQADDPDGGMTLGSSCRVDLVQRF
jgi:hypothetical protein